jgi:hypothetical protein
MMEAKTSWKWRSRAFRRFGPLALEYLRNTPAASYNVAGIGASHRKAPAGDRLVIDEGANRETVTIASIPSPEQASPNPNVLLSCSYLEKPNYYHLFQVLQCEFLIVFLLP